MIEVKEVLIHIVHRYQNMLNMANSVDPDETRRLIWLYTICKCLLFGFLCMRILTMSRQLRTLNFRQATPLLYNAYMLIVWVFMWSFLIWIKSKTPPYPHKNIKNREKFTEQNKIATKNTLTNNILTKQTWNKNKTRTVGLRQRAPSNALQRKWDSPMAKILIIIHQTIPIFTHEQ